MTWLYSYEYFHHTKVQDQRAWGDTDFTFTRWNFDSDSKLKEIFLDSGFPLVTSGENHNEISKIK